MSEKIKKILFDRIKRYTDEEYKLAKDIVSFLRDYNFKVASGLPFESLKEPYSFKFSNIDSTCGKCVFNDFLILDTYPKAFEELTYEDIDLALDAGQAVSIDELELCDLIWLLNQLDYQQRNK